MRLAFAVVLLLHGLIHLLGFVKAFGLAAVPQLTGRTLFALGPAWQRPVGVLWLLAACLTVLATALLLTHRSSWWMIGAAALVLSQLLILHAWPDAKAGTVVNVMLAIAVVLGWADARFAATSRAAVEQLFVGLGDAQGTNVTAAELAPLPAPVARWLTRAGVVGQPRARAVWLRQRGELRGGADQPFAEATSEQFFNAVSPGFVWTVRTTMKRVVPVIGRDSYLDGHGRMRITVGGLVAVVDAVGDPIDQGTLLRFLAELVWFPSAALSPYVQWKGLDDHAAEATMHYRGVTATARFTFDDEGHLINLWGRRYMSGDGAPARLEDWGVRATEWRRYDGIEVPTRGSVLWKLAAGELEYYRWEVQALEVRDVHKHR